MTAPTQGREIWRVNAFTGQPFAGNPAGVVPEFHTDFARMRAIVSLPADKAVRVPRRKRSSRWA